MGSDTSKPIEAIDEAWVGQKQAMAAAEAIERLRAETKEMQRHLRENEAPPWAAVEAMRATRYLREVMKSDERAVEEVVQSRGKQETVATSSPTEVNSQQEEVPDIKQELLTMKRLINKIMDEQQITQQRIDRLEIQAIQRMANIQDEMIDGIRDLTNRGVQEVEKIYTAIKAIQGTKSNLLTEDNSKVNLHQVNQRLGRLESIVYNLHKNDQLPAPEIEIDPEINPEINALSPHRSPTVSDDFIKTPHQIQEMLRYLKEQHKVPHPQPVESPELPIEPPELPIEPPELPIEPPELPKAPAPPTVDKLQTLREGRKLYQRYVTEHQDDLKIGDWVTILDNDYATATSFKTHNEAFDYYQGHRVRYCEEYKAPGPSTESIFLTTDAHFGVET